MQMKMGAARDFWCDVFLYTVTRHSWFADFGLLTTTQSTSHVVRSLRTQSKVRSMEGKGVLLSWETYIGTSPVRKCLTP